MTSGRVELPPWAHGVRYVGGAPMVLTAFAHGQCCEACSQCGQFLCCGVRLYESIDSCNTMSSISPHEHVCIACLPTELLHVAPSGHY